MVSLMKLYISEGLQSGFRQDFMVYNEPIARDAIDCTGNLPFSCHDRSISLSIESVVSCFITYWHSCFFLTVIMSNGNVRDGARCTFFFPPPFPGGCTTRLFFTRSHTKINATLPAQFQFWPSLKIFLHFRANMAKFFTHDIRPEGKTCPMV